MVFKKRATKSIALALVGVTLITPIYNTALAMEISNEINNIINYDEVIEISDTDMYKILLESGVNENILREAGLNEPSKLRYKEGVNKAVKVKNGYNIYLSKKTIKVIRDAGVGAASGAIGGLLGGASGGALAGVLGSLIANAVPEPKGGMIFRLRVKEQLVPVVGVHGATTTTYVWYLHSKVYQ